MRCVCVCTTMVCFYIAFRLFLLEWRCGVTTLLRISENKNCSVISEQKMVKLFCHHCCGYRFPGDRNSSLTTSVKIVTDILLHPFSETYTESHRMFGVGRFTPFWLAEHPKVRGCPLKQRQGASPGCWEAFQQWRLYRSCKGPYKYLEGDVIQDEQNSIHHVFRNMTVRKWSLTVKWLILSMTDLGNRFRAVCEHATSRLYIKKK